MFKRKRNFLPAFSLLELSIVLFISGILMAGMLSALSNITSGNKKRENELLLSRVSDTINVFFKENGRLPCPSDPTIISGQDYGVEKLDSSNICDYKFLNGQYINIDSGFANYHMPSNLRHKIVFGSLPFKTLSLPESFAYDAYGNKITYVVPQFLSTDRNKSNDPTYRSMNGFGRIAIPSNYYKKSSSCVQNCNSSSEIYPNICESATWQNPIIIYTLFKSNITETSAYSGVDVIPSPCRFNIGDYSGEYIARENIAFAIISHGKSGVGAWNKSGGRNSEPTSENVAKLRNTFTYYHLNCLSHDFTSENNCSEPRINLTLDSPKPDYDDLVIYKTTSDLMHESGLINHVYCHQSTINFDTASGNGGQNDPNCFIWSSQVNKNDIESLYSVQPNDATCGQGYNIGAKRVVDCMKGGVWINPR